MKKLLSLAAAVALAAAAQSPARADDAGDKNILQRGADATGDAIKKGGEAIGITGGDQERWEANAKGQHRVKGTVTSVDKDTGAVGLKTSEGTLQLHFPTDELAGIESGAPLTVMLAFATPDKLDETSEGTKATGRDVAGDQPLRGEHWMKGTVTKVDAKSGMVGVQTEDEMPLMLHFTPSAVGGLEPGDDIAVQIAYEPSAATKQEMQK